MLRLNSSFSRLKISSERQHTFPRQAPYLAIDQQSRSAMTARALPSAAEAEPASSEVSSQLPDLPGPAVACILQHVPLRQRLTCCALVCRSWAAAAAAAPAHVDCWMDCRERCEQLEDWLAQHGGVVVGLSARSGGTLYTWQRLQLPVPKLTQLRRLQLSRLNASSNSSAAGVTLPRLQELNLLECQLTVQLLSQLLSATTLSRLHWEAGEPRLYSSDAWPEQLKQGEAYAVLWQRLQLLPGLAELMLDVGNLTAADITPLSNLQHLQRLDVRITGHWSAEGIVMPYADRIESGPRQLLAALQHLTQLQHLQLEGAELNCGRAWPEQQWAGAQQEQGFTDGSYRCFLALTASTQLTSLVLRTKYDMPVPKAAIQYMFPPGRLMPQLKVLRLCAGWINDPCVEAAQVAMIASSCTALQQLELTGVTTVEFDTSCLAQLPSGVKRVQGLNWTRPA